MRQTIIILALLLTVSCQQPVTFSAEDLQQVTDEVTQMLHEYADAVEESGLTAEFPYLDSSDDFFWVPPGYTAPLSYDSVAYILKQYDPQSRSIVNTYDSLRIIPLSKTSAAYTATITSVTTDTAGKVSTYTLIESGTIIKRKDGWKLLCGQSAILK